MSERLFTDDHEWALADGDTVTVGITNYAQEQLGELVYVELPSVGTTVHQGDEAAVIESVKAAGDVKSPVCLLYTSPRPRDRGRSRMTSSA